MFLVLVQNRYIKWRDLVSRSQCKLSDIPLSAFRSVMSLQFCWSSTKLLLTLCASSSAGLSKCNTTQERSGSSPTYHPLHWQFTNKILLNHLIQTVFIAFHPSCHSCIIKQDWSVKCIWIKRFGLFATIFFIKWLIYWSSPAITVIFFISLAMKMWRIIGHPKHECCTQNV